MKPISHKYRLLIRHVYSDGYQKLFNTKKTNMKIYLLTSRITCWDFVGHNDIPVERMWKILAETTDPFFWSHRQCIVYKYLPTGFDCWGSHGLCMTFK